VRRGVALACACLAAVAGTVPAHAFTLRAARVSDGFGQNALTEWFTVRAIDPTTRRTLWLRFERKPLPALSLSLNTQDGRSGASWRVQPARTELRPHNGPGVTISVASLRHAGGRWLIRLDDGTLQGSLVLTGRPAVTAGPWRLGREPDPAYTKLVDGWMRWSALVGAGRLSGTLDVGGVKVALRGWPASLDHVWGHFRWETPSYHHHMNAVVFPRDGGSVILHGVEPGPGYGKLYAGIGNDARWTGVVVRATPTGTSFCRAAVRRSAWTDIRSLELGSVGVIWYPQRVTASCGRTRTSFSIPSRFVYASGTSMAAPLSAWRGLVESRIPPPR
jgi:hypothetical protein